MNSEASEVREVSPGYGFTAAKPALPVGYKQTEVGVIPKDWDVLKFGSLAEIVRGKFSARPRNDPRFYGGDYPFLQTGDVTRSGSKISSFTQTLNEEGVKVSRLFPKGTLFFTIAANIGDVGISEFGAACPDSLVAISPNSIVDKVWLLYELASRKEDFEALASPGAQLNINLEKLRPYLLPVPPLDEQRTIATALSDVDALLEELDRLIAKKRDIKQATMQQLLTGQTRLPRFEGEWQEKQLGQLGQFLKGSGVKRDESQTGSLPCVRYGEIYTLHHDIVRQFYSWISEPVAQTAVRIQKGDVLFAGSGETKEEIGKSVTISGYVEAYAGGDIVILRNNGLADPTFLGYALNQPAINAQKARFGQGDAVVHISASSLSQVTLHLPSLEEQEAISLVLWDMDMEIDALEQRRAKTAALKQAMMQELLTGRTRLVNSAG
ncbi:MAG: restriction endonuclease subunit S [Halomonas sp.]|nr:restriction endonuclease subunit S [Halomonas sp.]MBL1268543.1 restriction endonuclease subunit S [Halomonas sp.]